MSRNVERKVRVADSPAGTLCGELDGGGKGDGDGVYGNCDSDHDGHGCDGIGVLVGFIWHIFY